MNNSSAFKQLSDWMKTDLRPEYFETELKALIKREKQQLLKEVEESVMGAIPEERKTEHASHGWIQNGVCMACKKSLSVDDIRDEFGYNTAIDDCRTQIIKSIKELGGEL